MGKGKVFISIFCIMLAISWGILSGASANQSIDNKVFPIESRYSHTDRVTASLSFSGGQAQCNGTIKPSGKYSTSVTVTLYKMNGSSWSYITSWSGSATGGLTATAGGSISVDRGTYKVVTSGNVGGLEYPSAKTEKTY